MDIETLNESQLEIALTDLNRGLSAPWDIDRGKLHKAFQFNDFVSAFGFMSQVAIMAERINHHPEWSNAYSRVTVDLTTHEAGGITERDFALARKMEHAAK